LPGIRKYRIPAITYLPYPSFSQQIRQWLRSDDDDQRAAAALVKVNQLLAYTLQFIPIIDAVNIVLQELPAQQVIYRVAQLAENPFDWDLVHFASASLENKLKQRFLDGFFILPKIFKRNLLSRLDVNPRLDTQAHAAAAGFWYLHEQEPAQAKKAFTVTRSLMYGEEMYILADTLAKFNVATDITEISKLKIRPFPTESLLRKNTWDALNSLNHVVEDVQKVQRSSSRQVRAFAISRAIGEIRQILDTSGTIQQAERQLVINITQTWRTVLERLAGEVGKVEITTPVTSPYIVGDPVEGEYFVGREDIIRQLEEIWRNAGHMQSVVLYGHRRMGKTSILRNIAAALDCKVKVAYVNLQTVGDIEDVSEVLMLISDKIARVTDIPPLPDTDFINGKFRTLERYLTLVADQLTNNNGDGLIIALDEFETIEELIKDNKIPQTFMRQLRTYAGMSPKIGFALAGLHTLEEMTSDYFQAFYASVTPPIKVSFMTEDDTKIILANPSSKIDFPLDYTPEALTEIYALTHGQPFLTQLVGSMLVRQYNNQMFHLRQKRDPIFTIDDVKQITENPNFFTNGNYYFDGVWRQASQGAKAQQQVLQILSDYPQGLTCHQIYQHIINLNPVVDENLEQDLIQEALHTLQRHDVIQEKDGFWLILVELFRRWVVGRKSY
ncbi:MAG: ATP-binding protein, partial [Mastigocoleus sp. MO_167.B18]|nr:ATP-binding protein [Mastigocoleus sp. MO_167.B18]